MNEEKARGKLDNAASTVSVFDTLLQVCYVKAAATAQRLYIIVSLDV